METSREMFIFVLNILSSTSGCLFVIRGQEAAGISSALVTGAQPPSAEASSHHTSDLDPMTRRRGGVGFSGTKGSERASELGTR